MRYAAVVLVATLTFATAADAQRVRGGNFGVGPGGRTSQAGAGNIQQLRDKALVAQQEREKARQEREAAFEKAVAQLDGQAQAIKDKAAAEMRPLTPQEEARVAALSARVAQMKENREERVADAKDKAQDAAGDLKRDRQVRQSGNGDCIAAGNNRSGRTAGNGALAGMGRCGF